MVNSYLIEKLIFMNKFWHTMMNNMPLAQDQNIICDARAPNKMAKNAALLPIFLHSSLCIIVPPQSSPQQINSW